MTWEILDDQKVSSEEKSFELDPNDSLESNFTRWFAEVNAEKLKYSFYGFDDKPYTQQEAREVFFSQYKNRIAESWFMNKEGRMEQRLVIDGD